MFGITYNNKVAYCLAMRQRQEGRDRDVRKDICTHHYVPLVAQVVADGAIQAQRAKPGDAHARHQHQEEPTHTHHLQPAEDNNKNTSEPNRTPKHNEACNEPDVPTG